MTRRKKTKSTVSQNAPSGVTASPVAAKAATAVVSKDNITSTSQHPLPARHTLHLSTSPHPAAKSSSPRSSVPSSITDEVASTKSTENNDKESKNIQRKRKPVHVKVTYVTEQVNIYPKYPILTVERLRNLDNHINMLTESIGRRPRVYQHGKGVKFIPETNEEYRIIQRYLGKIESAERIAWCSYVVPIGNSIKVNVKVRKVEILKITENLQKQNLENGTNQAITKSKDSSNKDIKTSTKDSSLQNIKVSTKDSQSKEVQLSTKDSSLQKGHLTLNEFLPKEAKLPTKDEPVISNGLKESKPEEMVPKDLQVPKTDVKNVKKKMPPPPRDIAQNRSYKRKTVY